MELKDIYPGCWYDKHVIISVWPEYAEATHRALFKLGIKHTAWKDGKWVSFTTRSAKAARIARHQMEKYHLIEHEMAKMGGEKNED